MTDNVFFRPSLQRSPVESQQGWRHALVLGVAALVLTGCGGGSDSESTPPAPTPSAPAAPENFTVGSSLDFSWTPTATATRYELFVDPDGSGPLAETQRDPQRFSYSLASDGSRVTGSFGAYVNFPEALNASYRLRACNAAGCGSFSDTKAFDITKCISLHGHAVQGCSHSSAHRSKLWLEYHNARFRTQRQKSAVAAASVTAIGCLLRRWGRAVGRRQYLGSAIHETNLDQHRHPRRDRRGVYVPAQRQHMERAGPARHQHRTVNLRPTLPS